MEHNLLLWTQPERGHFFSSCLPQTVMLIWILCHNLLCHHFFFLYSFLTAELGLLTWSVFKSHNLLWHQFFFYTLHNMLWSFFLVVMPSFFLVLTLLFFNFFYVHFFLFINNRWQPRRNTKSVKSFHQNYNKQYKNTNCQNIYKTFNTP